VGVVFIALLAAIAVFIAVTVFVLVVTSDSSGARKVESRLAQMDRKQEARPMENVLRTDTGTFPLLRWLASGNAWSERTERDLARAGWGLKVSEFVLLRVFLAAILAITAILLGGSGGGSVLLALLLGAAGFMLPALLLYFYRSRRQNAITKQLAETLSLISNSLRSGFAFTQAVELAAKQLEPPISEELARFLHDVSLGAPTDVALQEMAERTGSYDLDMMVATIVIQRSTGGNLSEILDNVAETIRERDRLQGEIRALTASQRFTGLILSVYPVLLGMLFFALAPDTWDVLITTELGRILLVAAGVLQVMGMVTIRRILRLEV
jgi:tight adherence protein B